MRFFAFGLNFEQATVEVRERFALSEAVVRTVYRSVPRTPEAEWMLLSTCNRIEGYVFGRPADVHSLKAALSMHAGRPWPEESSFLLEDEAAIQHVVQVTSGLRSLVLGDAQIFAQLKEAYRLAVEEEVLGTVMHRLMHTAFRAAKRVASETGLGSGASSVSSAAAVVARQHLEATHGAAWAEARVALIGTGQMGRLALEALRDQGVTDVTIFNRTLERAATIAAAFGAQARTWEDRHAVLAEADVVLVATGAPEPVLRADEAPDREPASRCLLVDIAVPRNADAAFEERPGYEVVDIDDLQTRIDEVVASRRAEIPAAEACCDEAVAEFVSWVFHQQALQPAIAAIRESFETIRQQEIDRHQHRFAETELAEVDRLTSSILQKLLAVPIVRLKSVDPGSVDFVRGVKLLSTLFSRPECDEASMPERAAAQRAAAIQETPPIHPPARCPFETHAPQGRPGGEEVSPVAPSGASS